MQVSLSMKSDLSSLYLSILLIDLISNQNDWDVITDSSQVLVPFRNVFVCNSGCDIEHENGGICTDIISLSKATKLFLASSIPKRKFDRSVVSVEGNRADFNTLSGDVFFFELTGNVSFNEGGFSDSTISNEDNFKFSDDLRPLHLGLLKYYYVVGK